MLASENPQKTATDAELIAQLQAIIALNTDFVKK